MKLLVVLIALALGGCASVDALQGGIADRGAAVSDEALQTAEWTLCKAISVGSWVRAFGENPGKAAAWRTLCATSIQETPSKGATP